MDWRTAHRWARERAEPRSLRRHQRGPVHDDRERRRRARRQRRVDDEPLPVGRHVERNTRAWLHTNTKERTRGFGAKRRTRATDRDAHDLLARIEIHNLAAV